MVPAIDFGWWLAGGRALIGRFRLAARWKAGTHRQILAGGWLGCARSLTDSGWLARVRAPIGRFWLVAGQGACLPHSSPRFIYICDTSSCLLCSVPVFFAPSIPLSPQLFLKGMNVMRVRMRITVLCVLVEM